MFFEEPESWTPSQHEISIFDDMPFLDDDMPLLDDDMPFLDDDNQI